MASGALGAVSVVTESVSQSAGVARPQEIQTRIRQPRRIIPLEGTLGSTSLASQAGHGSFQAAGGTSCRKGGGDADHGTGQQVVIFSLKEVQHHEWAP